MYDQLLLTCTAGNRRRPTDHGQQAQTETAAAALRIWDDAYPAQPNRTAVLEARSWIGP